MTQTNTTTGISTDILRQLAFMQFNGEEFFILNGKAYEGSRKEADKSYSEMVNNDEDVQFEEYCNENLTEISDYDNDNYLVLTDEEADEKAAEYIKNSLWAFNPSFLASMTDLDEEVFQAISDNGKCESNNDVIYNTIHKTCGIKEFVSASISSDGRGHFMSSYDGHENEETVNELNEETGNNETTFYIYRTN